MGVVALGGASLADPLELSLVQGVILLTLEEVCDLGAVKHGGYTTKYIVGGLRQKMGLYDSRRNRV